MTVFVAETEGMGLTDSVPAGVSDNGAKYLEFLSGIVLMYIGEGVLTEQFFWRITGDALDGGAGVANRAVIVQHNHNVEGGLDQGPELRLSGRAPLGAWNRVSVVFWRPYLTAVDGDVNYQNQLIVIRNCFESIDEGL